MPDAVTGVKHRYGYLASFSKGECDGGYFDGLTQFDLDSETETNWFEPGTVVGEPSFAPDMEAQGDTENAGWVVAYTHLDGGARSEFIVIDARDFEAGPIARIPMPRRVPFGFHGNWMTPED